MNVIFLIVDIVTMVASVLPKVVDFIESILKLKQDTINDAREGGASEADMDTLLGNIRESTIEKTHAEFHGSGSVVPEPIIRILYEWVVLKNWAKPEWGNRLMTAIRKGFIGEPLSPREQIDRIKIQYPEMFGKRR